LEKKKREAGSGKEKNAQKGEKSQGVRTNQEERSPNPTGQPHVGKGWGETDKFLQAKIQKKNHLHQKNPGGAGKETWTLTGLGEGGLAKKKVPTQEP